MSSHLSNTLTSANAETVALGSHRFALGSHLSNTLTSANATVHDQFANTASWRAKPQDTGRAGGIRTPQLAARSSSSSW